MDESRVSDDAYIPMDTETYEDKASTGSKVAHCFKKFLLAIIAIGLIALLVFQIIIIASASEVKAEDPDVANAAASST